jgi:hypothetical protein
MVCLGNCFRLKNTEKHVPEDQIFPPHEKSEANRRHPEPPETISEAHIKGNKNTRYYFIYFLASHDPSIIFFLPISAPQQAIKPPFHAIYKKTKNFLIPPE